jgi:hypothetical protein
MNVHESEFEKSMSSYDDGVGENRLGVESSSHVHGGN